MDLGTLIATLRLLATQHAALQDQITQAVSAYAIVLNP